MPKGKPDITVSIIPTQGAKAEFLESTGKVSIQSHGHKDFIEGLKHLYTFIPQIIAKAEIEEEQKKQIAEKEIEKALG